MAKFSDGLVNITNNIVNKRNVQFNNKIESTLLTPEDRNKISKTGIGRTIIEKKFGYCLADRLVFANTADEQYYNVRLKKAVNFAFKQAGVQGRGIIVCFNPDQNLNIARIGTVDPKTCIIRYFSGYEVSVIANVDTTNLRAERYLQPLYYLVQGNQIHYSHVVDFKYVEPIIIDYGKVKYGGISEFDLIYDELTNDQILSRAGVNGIERNSTLFYQMTDFATNIQEGNDDFISKYISQSEDLRSIFGAGIIDEKDNVISVNQNLSDFAVVMDYIFRKVSMVTGIAMTELIGERLVGGIGGNNDIQEDSYMRMIKRLGEEYALPPINELASMLGMGPITFKDSMTPKALLAQAKFESIVLDNAVKLHSVGIENVYSYIAKYSIVEEDEQKDLFPDVKDEDLGYL